MAGINHRVIPRTFYDFSNIAASNSQTVVIAKAIPAIMWREATLLVRLHDVNGNTWAASTSLAVNLLSEGYTDEDPQSDFLWASASLAAVTFSPGSGVPTLSYNAASTPLGSYLRVTLVATQPAAPGAHFQAHISVDLSLKA